MTIPSLSDLLKDLRDKPYYRRRFIGSLVIVLGFIVFRVFTFSVFDSEGVLRAIREDLAENYKTEIYRKYGLDDGLDQEKYDEAVAREGGVPLEQFEDLKVELYDVSMSGSIFRWSAQEDVEVRFSYRLFAEGELKQKAKRVYRRVSRKGAYNVWDSEPLFYYVHYLL